MNGRDTAEITSPRAERDRAEISSHPRVCRADMTDALPQRGAGNPWRRPRPQSRDPWHTNRRLAAVLHRRHSSNTRASNRDGGSHISCDAARARRFTRGQPDAHVRADDLGDLMGEAGRAPPRCGQRAGARASYPDDHPITIDELRAPTTVLGGAELAARTLRGHR